MTIKNIQHKHLSLRNSTCNQPLNHMVIETGDLLQTQIYFSFKKRHVIMTLIYLHSVSK